jgi:hypothetical protein
LVTGWRVSVVSSRISVTARAEFTARALLTDAKSTGALTARARLESHTLDKALTKSAGSQCSRGSGRAGREGDGGKGGGGRGLGATYIDAELEALRNLQRATVALEEAVEDQKRREFEESDRMRLKRIRLREEWGRRGAEAYGRVGERLRQMEEDKQRRLEQSAAKAKRKLQLQLSWCRLGFTHVRRVNAGEAMRQDCVNEVWSAVMAGVNAHIEASWRKETVRRMQGRALLRTQKELREEEYARARLLHKAVVLQRSLRCHAARVRMRERREPQRVLEEALRFGGVV